MVPSGVKGLVNSGSVAEVLRIARSFSALCQSHSVFCESVTNRGIRRAHRSRREWLLLSAEAFVSYQRAIQKRSTP